ncbi:MAG: hypothetical protein WCP32_11105 [Bacteroidota bacterium]
MKTIQKIIVFFLMMLPLIGKAENKAIPFSLDDRDRIIRTEQKVESVKTEMNTRFENVDRQFTGFRSEMNARFESIDKRFEAMDKRFDQLFNYLWAFIGIFTTMMVSVFGFAFWDRKLSLTPMKKENLKTLNALRDFAKYQPRLQEILKTAGLL